ncbi:glycosyltransferase [Paracoccus benzoatiresistens]|uniref:Glycosyltransferase n=1 Tax=Paracoccus benzoatiresistens TaxID=2997341 RepID=A0ABT4J037_9RHOB|nr:glycosyltransferase [Paracoccus sp. EF6]MCZ0960472.1 glycosyltransferase [Paracoccus sp. EF6]
MKIVGICRFSMIGQGDWKAYRNLEAQDLEKIYIEKERELFTESRMETRFRTFEKLTLASLQAQTDQDFLFVVVSSSRMPSIYRSRLEKLCAAYPNVLLRFVAPMHIVDAQKDILAELGLRQQDCLQFRLDDDDALSKRFVERLRMHGQALWEQYPVFAISFPNLIYSVIDGETKGLYRWFNPFLGIGLAVRNPKRSVYGYAHYKIPQAVIGLTDPSICSLVTHHGMNDTPRHRKEILRKRGMVRSSLDELQRLINQNFDFLSAEGRSLAGLVE